MSLATAPRRSTAAGCTPPNAPTIGALRVDRRRRDTCSLAVEPAAGSGRIRPRRRASTSSAVASRRSQYDPNAPRHALRRRSTDYGLCRSRRRRDAGRRSSPATPDPRDRSAIRYEFAPRRWRTARRGSTSATALTTSFADAVTAIDADVGLAAARVTDDATGNGGWTRPVELDQRHAGLRLVRLLPGGSARYDMFVEPHRPAHPNDGLARRLDAVRRAAALRRPPTCPNGRAVMRSTDARRRHWTTT